MSSNQFQILTQADLTATIASIGTTSEAIDLMGCELVGLHLPSSFTGTTIKITTAPTLGGTYQNVLSGGSDYTLAVAQGKYVPIENLAILAGCRFIKIVSGSSEAAERVITLATRPI